MFRTLLLATLAFVLAIPAPGNAACAGPDPAITSVAVKSVTRAGGVNHYTLVGTVTNAGSQAQAGNTLQFVDIAQRPGEKLDAKGIPPLRAGESYTFSYQTLRAADAGNGTTTLHFQLDERQPAGSDCNAGNDSFTLTF